MEGQCGYLSPPQVALFRRFTGWPGVTPLCGISRFALGRAGGLCVAWKEGDEIEPWLVEKNIISCNVYSDSPFQLWSFSAVYGPPMASERRNFWRNLVGEFRISCRAGRTVLAQSVAAAIPAYALMSPAVPLNICKKIDAVIGDFWSGGRIRGEEDFVFEVLEIYLCP